MLPLSQCTLEEYQPEKYLFCFSVITPGKSQNLRAGIVWMEESNVTF
jgi:hypothetical protein